MQSVKKIYRQGAIGALMDEYERAVAELRRILEQLPEDDFVRIVDSLTKDEDCRSVQTIMSHVVNAGYGYADYIRVVFSIPSRRPLKRKLSRQESLDQLEAMLAYTVETLDGRWEISEEEITAVVIKTNWGPIYDLEGLLEHAIVHILRHRRQIERFIASGAITAQSV